MKTETLNKDHFLGFESLKDFANALLGSRKTHRMLIITSLAVLFGFSITQWIEEWVFSPYWGLIFLTGVCVLDLVGAIGCALTIPSTKLNKAGEPVLDPATGEAIMEIPGFKTRKATKWGITLFSLFLLISIAHVIPKLLEEQQVKILSAEVWIYFENGFFWYIILLKLSSGLKHLARLGVLPKAIANFFVKFVDTHKDHITKAVETAAAKPKAHASDTPVEEQGGRSHEE